MVFTSLGFAGSVAISKMKILLESEPGHPILAPVVGQSAMMGLVATAHRVDIDHLAEGRGVLLTSTVTNLSEPSPTPSMPSVHT